MELTPKQKAKELYEYYFLSGICIFEIPPIAALRLAQNLAIEMIKEPAVKFCTARLEYWNSVKLELENIEI